MKTNSKGHFFIIVGPSGVGKNTLISEYMKKHEGLISFPVSVTTRAKREGERDGVNYYFHTKEEFEEMIKNEEFLEWAKVFNNYYGTLKKTVNKMLDNGISLIKDIDIQGALALKNKLPQDTTTTIFIAPPSFEELENRIRARGLDSEEAMQKRLKDARHEIEFKNKFDIIITNNELSEAYTEFENTIDKITNKR